MHRFPTRNRRYLKFVILAMLLTAHAGVVANNYFRERQAAQSAAILNDPLMAAITPSQFGLEVVSAESERPGDDQWKAYCYRARASLVERARFASAATSRD